MLMKLHPEAIVRASRHGVFSVVSRSCQRVPVSDGVEGPQSLGAQINGIPGGCVHRRQRGSPKRTFNGGCQYQTQPSFYHCVLPPSFIPSSSFLLPQWPLLPPAPAPALPLPSQVAHVPSMASSGKPRATPSEPRRCVRTTREGGQCKNTRIDLAYSRHMCRQHCNAAGPCKLAQHVLRTPQCQTASLSLDPPPPLPRQQPADPWHLSFDNILADITRPLRLFSERLRSCCGAPMEASDASWADIIARRALVCTLFILAGIAPSHHRMKLRCIKVAVNPPDHHRRCTGAPLI
ncbi:hypothetical protein C8J57DRAFT_380387 [Mycena rebaudengoi]|nr:hypothetical protein C8J57DRAFT_380387 [Mycena rebaudengoi]